MLHYFKFREELFAPVPGRDIYVKPGPGRGWPQECPPIRAACAFGFDLLANFDVTFTRRGGRWIVEPDIIIDSDFAYSRRPGSEGAPLAQQYAWPWKKGQKLPHVITDNVYAAIRNQMKVSTFLFLKTDRDEMLYMTDVPNMMRPWRALTALIETDWYPASYPWHTVIELDPREKKIAIAKGDPLCRVIPVRRGAYAAAPMTPRSFDAFFTSGQDWLIAHGKLKTGGTVDITRSYVRQQRKSKFVVKEPRGLFNRRGHQSQ